jgi:DNA repair photolyase
MIDDRRHPLLSKAEPVGQTELGDQRAPKDRLGQRRVQEVEADQALTDFTRGGTVTGEAWSLNPYAGCHHACRYCYVPDTMSAERKRWGRYVLVKRNLPRLLRDELDRKDARTVYLSTGTDPYQPVEAERELTRKLLRQLAREDWPVEVLTRSPLVLRDLDVLDEFTHVRVGMSVPTLDDDVREILEPAAPEIDARLDALRELSQAGLAVFANYAPACPFTGDLTAMDVAEAFAEAGVQWVNTSFFRRRGSIVVPIWDEVRGTEDEQLASFVANREPQHELRQDLQDALGRLGIPLHTAFYNPPFGLAELGSGHKQLKLHQVPVEAEARSPQPRAEPVLRR